MRIALLFHLLHSFWVPSVFVHAKGAAWMKLAVSILELVAAVELIHPVFECATKYLTYLITDWLITYLFTYLLLTYLLLTYLLTYLLAYYLFIYLLIT